MTNNLTLSRTLIFFAFCSTGFISSAFAEVDERQRQLSQRIIKAKQIQQEAQSTKGVERRKILNKHMKLMHENMELCRTLKPSLDLTEKERDEWFREQQKIMDQLMDQMIFDYRLVAELNGFTMDTIMHKHFF